MDLIVRTCKCGVNTYVRPRSNLVAMNQREALLDGAKQCLVEKGYARTTARDIASASGAHLGSIGYHFGSKDRLMSMAAIELSSEWGDTIEDTVRTVDGVGPAERLQSLLAELVATIPAHREAQSASLQAFAQSLFDDELREHLSATLIQARCEIAAIVLGVPSVEPGSSSERGLGTFAYALVTGLVAQALVDPQQALDADVVAGAIQAITGAESSSAPDGRVP